MEQHELKSLLRQLESELRTADPKNPAHRALLRRLTEDIGVLLNEASVGADQQHGFRGRLAEAATAFEMEHPRLAATLENVVNQLAQLNL